MARLGVLWRVLGMASYRAYLYCDKCDRPLRKNEYRREAPYTGGGVSYTYYCRLCNALARTPFSMAVWVGIVLWTCLLVLLAAQLLGEPIYTYSQAGERLLLVFVVIAFSLGYFARGWWKKSKCKPIYDRWVTHHGVDPENWPDAPKLYRTSENRKLPKWKQIVALFTGFLVVSLIWYNNYKAGLF